MCIKYHLPVFLALTLTIALNGCTSKSDQVKAGYYNGDESITYGQAFAVAFDNGIWSVVKDEQGAKVAQFTGKISPGLNAYALGKLKKSDERIIFSSALSYLASLIRTGKTTGQPDITFNTGDYPINKQGNIYFDSLGDYISSPDNQPKIQILNTFYMGRYWESKSDCSFRWKIFARGKMSQVVGMSNPHWDDDGLFSKKPENVLKLVFEYAKSVSPVKKPDAR